jgi:hypothetical protein
MVEIGIDNLTEGAYASSAVAPSNGKWKQELTISPDEPE